MQIHTTYKVKIKHYNHIFKDTVTVYRHAVDYLIDVCNTNWDMLSAIDGAVNRQRYIETLVHKTKDNINPTYNFDGRFYKMPSYLRRGAINEAIGKIFSYRSNLLNWETTPSGKMPSVPKAGYVFPSMYRTVMYNRTDIYEAQIKVFIRNTWDWITLDLRKSDVDYITKHCLPMKADSDDPSALRSRKICAPTLQKRGKEWYLDFPIEENVILNSKKINDQIIAAVDLGINNACTVSIMQSDGTILGREFLPLPSETDSLTHAVNRIKKAQQHGNCRTPRLWAKAKGINDRIAVLTAQFIVDKAVLYNVDTIVFEHLDRKGKLHGSKKQKLHLWNSQYVQEMVAIKCHRLGMRISHICAWGTSRLAYDGSGCVLRGREAGLKSYSICRFQNGKEYNCDLNASYNIGARFFIRELTKSVPVTARLAIEAKVPQCAKRSTCTLSTLINLNAVLSA